MKLKKGFMITAISIMFIACCVLSFLSLNDTRLRSVIADGNVSYSQSGFEDGKAYVLGDTINFPTEIVKDGKTYSVYTIVYCPNGETYRKQSIELTQAGKYKVKFYSGNNNLVHTADFSVKQYLYSGDDITTRYYSVDDVPGISHDAMGMAVNLSAKDTLSYVEPINIADNTINDSIIELSMLTGVSDLTICLSDIIDSSRDITIYLVASVWNGCYVKAKIGDGDFYGLEAWSGADFVHGGMEYRVHINNAFGAHCPVTLSGPDSLHPTLRLSLDYATGQIYINNTLVTDFKDERLYPCGWDGFSDGLCKLSVYSNSVSTARYEYVITKLDGKAITSRIYSEDVTPPVIYIDTNEMNGAVPIVDKAFKIPEAFAVDLISGRCQIEKSVYVNYGQSNQTLIFSEDDKFTPTIARKYTIEYKAKDLFGNETIEKCDLQAYSSSEKPDLMIDVIGQHSASVSLGAKVEIADYEIKNVNGVAKVSVQIKSTYENYVLEAGKNYFYPLYAGVYAIEYVCSDYVSTATASYIITATQSDAKALIKDDAVIPKYIIKNAKYSVPVAYGYTFKNGRPIETRAEVYIANDQNLAVAQKITGDTFTFNGNSYCYICFKIDDSIQWHKIKVVDVEYDGDTSSANVAKYFVALDGTNLTYDAYESEVDYRLASSGNRAGMEFVNKLQVFDFSIDLKVPENKNYNRFALNFEETSGEHKISLILEDIYDDWMVAYVNEDKKVSFKKSASGEMTIGYKEDESLFTITIGESKVALYIDKGILYDKWDGFKDYMANVSIEIFSDSSVNGNIKVMKVNNQLVTNQFDSNTFAQYSMAKMAGRFSPGTEVTISGIVVADVLSPYVTVVPSITDDKGNKIDINDYTKDYVVRLDGIIRYYVSYRISDGNISTTYQYAVYSADQIPPEIKFAAGYVTKAKLNETVQIANATAEDDISGNNCPVKTYIITPNNERTIAVSSSFVATVKGVYKVYYLAQDTVGNMSMRYYTITVE